MEEVTAEKFNYFVFCTIYNLPGVVFTCRNFLEYLDDVKSFVFRLINALLVKIDELYLNDVN